MHEGTANATLDWLVITTANRRQAGAVRMQLDERARRGALPPGCRTLVVPDAREARIGSGAATVLALAAVARRDRAAPDGRRVLVLHSGGDSRRLPAYAAEGKLFASLPMAAPGMRCGTVFDLLLEDVLALAPRAGGEVIVAAGDCVIGMRQHPVTLDGPGVIGVAQRASAARAMRHGVYVADARGAVRAFLQKPSVDAMRRARALDARERALVDTGLVSFDADSARALMAAAGVTRGRDGRVRVRRGSLADGAARAALPHVDLYRELMCGFAPARRRAAQPESADPTLRRVLAPIHAAMRARRFACRVTESGAFLHVGSTREMLASLVGPGAPVAEFGLRSESDPVPPRRLRGTGHAVALDTVAGEVHVRTGRAVLDRCEVGRADLGGDNLVVGVRARTLRLPRGVSVFTVPLRGGARVAVACGERDDFKMPLGTPGAPGDGTLWDAPMWPECSGPDGLDGVRWMWDGARASRGRAATRTGARLRSMREIVAEADLEAIARERSAIAIANARSVDVRTLHAVGDPLRRARLAARAALDAPGTYGAAPKRRAAAFAAVGEAVLERMPLPSRPACAVVLHDQAVWASAPVRMDLAGGWSDTPPICNEAGGAVVNMAITLRGQLPVQVTAKLDEEPVLRITSTDLGRTRVIRSARELVRRGDPVHWAALAESALVLTGLAPPDPGASLGRWLARVGGGVSLTLFSAVPKGSGLGTSSILGAAVIRALDRVSGRERTPDELVAATSALEQMLSTRGGWQDQVGGAIGGFKLARTAPGAAQHPRVERLRVPAAALRELESRSVLLFTGTRRMAKGILENVVWNWLSGTATARDAVRRLHANAHAMRGALEEGDVDAVVRELSEYRELKRRMDPGSCTPAFEALAARWRTHLAGWCFAGAGGGGFVLLVAHDARHAARLRADLVRRPPHPRARAFDLEVDAGGLRCAVL